MPTYQGRALRSDSRATRASGGWGVRIARVAIVFVVGAVLVHLPWGTLRRRFAVVTNVQAQGLHYLDLARIEQLAGIHPGDDLLALDLDRARQALLLEPRIAGAELHHSFPRGVCVRVEERVPVLLVRHGVPWELDSAGVLLAPLQPGVVADVPLLAGPDFEAFRPGTQVKTREVERGLAWVKALEVRELGLTGQVSEVDVSDPRFTALILMSGTRVLAPAEPLSTRELSALRVVLADLERKGTVAGEVDLRFAHQVIVRPIGPAGGDPAAGATATRKG